MKKQTTRGSTGSRRGRSLSAFGHHNPVARLISMIAAFAMATLLVAGTGTAYADESAPSDTSTTETAVSEEPAAEETSAAEESDAPAQEQNEPGSEESTGDSAEEGGSGPGETSSDGAQSSGDAAKPAAPKSSDDSAAGDTSAPQIAPALQKLASPLAAPVDVTVPCGDSDADFLVGGFAIDGDLCVNDDEDWDSVDFALANADFQVDGFDDDTSFTQGDSENNDPSTWHIDGPTPNGKTDIGTAYAYSKTVGDDVFGYFAFTNTSTDGGTQQYDVEYNQGEATENANGATVVVRQPGDLLFRFSSTGADPLVFDQALIYTLQSSDDWDEATCFEITSSDPAGGWCEMAIPAGSFKSDASDDGLFQEGSLEITAFFEEGTCSGVFGTTQIRSVTGNSFETSALKDYVFPLDVTTPSNCGSLRIEKVDADDPDTLVGGAIFSIEGDPRPGGSLDDVLCIYDGTQGDLDDILADATDDPDVEAILAAECDDVIADGESDGVITIGEAEAGTYVVTELVAPPGYLLDPTDNDETVEVGQSGTSTANAEVTFANHKQWAPLDVSKTATGHNGAQYFWTVNKQIAPTDAGPWSDGTTPADPLVKNDDGTDTNLYYRVTVSEDHVETSAYVVDGTITVHNPNDAPVTATIHESLDNCVIDGGTAGADVTRSVAPDVNGVGTDYDYSCDLGNGPVDPGTNTATVTWDRSDYPQSGDDLLPENADEVFTDQGSDGFDFADVTTVDETVTVEDDHFDFPGGWTITWGDEADGVYESDVYSVDSAAVAGTCSEVITNTVTVTGDDGTVTDGDGHDAQDSESGQVCVGADLTATIDDSESLTRTFPWSIQKATTTPNVTVTNGAASATYDVTVTTGDQEDSGWQIGGTIVVSNPNDWEDVPLTGLSVNYSGSNDADKGDDCVVTESLTDPIPAGGDRTFHYSCTFTSEPDYDGSIDADVTWDAAAASTPHGVPADPVATAVVAADWDVTEVDSTVTVHDDQATGKDVVIGTLDWATVYGMDQHRTVIHYTVSLTGLPSAGSCNTKVNTVWIVGHDLVHLDADENSANNVATVRVCASAVVVLPPKPPQHPQVLPNTGGPDAWLFAAGLALLLAGGTLVLADQRRKRRS